MLEEGQPLCRRINQRNLTVEDQQRLWEHEEGGMHHSNAEHVTGAYDAYMSPHIPGDVQCHWYHHDWWGGTQVLLMESEAENYVAIVYKVANATRPFRAAYAHTDTVHPMDRAVFVIAATATHQDGHV